MRRTYALSVESIKVINGHATDVAEEFGCDPSYIHNILGGTQTDPFSKFLWLYSSAVKAGCDVSHWDNRLDAIKAKQRAKTACLHTAVTTFTKESADFTVSHLKGETPEKKLAELDDILAPLEDARRALLNEINERDDELSARFNGKPISYDTRQAVKAKMRAV